MKVNILLFLFLIMLIIDAIAAKKGKLKIGKKIKRLFVGKKHHNKDKKETTTAWTESIKSARASVLKSVSAKLASISIPLPTATTFNNIPGLHAGSEVYITLTDRNYNYFLGYPTAFAGVNYFRNPRFMVAGRRPCGCCDNKIIIVTRAPDERII